MKRTIDRVGRLGLEEEIEPRVRRVVADRLGVDARELTPGISLADDLAADSLDLLEVAIELESELGISLPERRLELVRSYDDLLGLVLAQVTAMRQRILPALAPEIQTRVVRENGTRMRAVERAVELTPYAAEIVTEDVLRAGPGAHLEVVVEAGVGARTVARIRALFAGLTARGIAVQVRTEPALIGRARHVA